MRPVTLAPPPTSDKAKLDWCVRAIQEIATSSRLADPNTTADGFTPSNVTDTRTFDADSTTLAEVADVLGTFISDLKKRGAKKTS